MKKNLFLILVLLNHFSYSQALKATEFKALVNIQVSDLKDQPIVGETVIFVTQKEEKEFQIKTNEKGKAQILLPKGKTYDVKYKDLIEKVKHSSFEVPSGLGKYSFDITIKFEPSDIVVLKGIQFLSDGSVNEISAMELDMMKDVLEVNPKMEIMVAAHSDNSESKEISKEKTQNQANAIKKYLVDKGIKKERIKAVGFGDEEPIAPNVLPEGREKNNRIEIRVTKKYL